MCAAAMARQHPFEMEFEQTLHRFCLFGPRVPCHIAECDQSTSVVGPCEVIAREHELIPVQEDHMASRVTGHRNRKKVCFQLDRFLSIQQLLCFNSSSIGGMNNAAATEMFVIYLV